MRACSGSVTAVLTTRERYQSLGLCCFESVVIVRRMSDEKKVTTTDAGIPATSDEFSLTVGEQGPIALHDHYVVQKMQHFNRERVPERVVHAKGGGAHGIFQVTEDVSQFTKADHFQPGKETELFLRFSTVAGEQGFPDTVRDPRGFAIKFYTEKGNWDMVGNNTPVFFVRDPSKFSDFIHSQKREPGTGLHSHDIQWDFWTMSPESAHQVTILMSDRGIPRSWRHQHGFSSHTYSWINAGGEKFWVKYHFRTDQGIENIPESEADEIAGTDKDYHRRDLINAIDKGDHPSWTLYVQVMPFAEAADYRFNPFDLTKVWPKGDYPLIEVGRMTLNRNPENFFAEVEQSTFKPANLVPGTGLSPDKMLMGRIFSYHDTHLHRVGKNSRAAADQRSQGRGQLLQPRRVHDLPQRRRHAQLRAQHQGRPGRDRRRARRRPGLGRGGRRAGPLRQPQARRGRRLRPGAHALQRGHGGREPRGAGRGHRGPRQQAGGHRRDARARDRLLGQRGRRPGRQGGGRPGQGQRPGANGAGPASPEATELLAERANRA